MQTDAVAGAILGCAVGDALGLPYEGMSARRGARVFGEPSRHRFVLGQGMVSDDTEHTCMVAQCLCSSPNDPDAFARQLGRRLRWWLAGLPAGIGFATLKATLKLWMGFPVSRSGVFSAGNGPAMRSAVLGAAIDDPDLLNRFVRASTTLTHTDPKALHGALAVAVAAWCARRDMTDPDEFLRQFHAISGPDGSAEFSGLLNAVRDSVRAGETTPEFARRLGGLRGVSGYVFRTVPVVLHGWLCRPRDCRAAIQEMIGCGGDTDTTAAILGAIIGSGVGRAGLPSDWLAGVREWPRSVAWMERLAGAVTTAVRENQPVRPPGVFVLAGWLRNLFFLAVVLTHVVRRMLPPY